MLNIPAWVSPFLKPSTRRTRKSSVAHTSAADVEVLDTRVMLSGASVAAVVPPPAASSQSVTSFLTGEGAYIAVVNVMVSAEAQAIQSLGNAIPASIARSVLNFDKAIAKIDADGVGQATGKIGGVDGVIIANYPSFAATATTYGAQVQAQLKAIANVEASLTPIANGGGKGSLTAVDQLLWSLTVDLERTAANDLNNAFIKLAPSFVGTNLGPSMATLGVDIAALAKLSPPITAATTPTTAETPAQAVTDFLTGEGAYITVVNIVVNAEAQAVHSLGTAIPAAVARQIIKFDNAILKIDADGVGQATGKVGGVDGVIIANYPNSAATATTYAAQVQAQMIAIGKVEASLTPIANSSSTGSWSPVDQLLWSLIVDLESTAANDLNNAFIKLAPSFVGTNLGPSMKTLGNDIAALAALRL